MNRLVPLLAAVAVALVVGTQFGWRWVFAPLLGIAIWVWMRATMRSFLTGGQTGVSATDEPQPLSADERVLYWCEECGTEVVLLVRGSGIAPRHCATKMHERSEILS
jgi:DNA-directed RNA polymerase subunit RPC12/RpoP